MMRRVKDVKAESPLLLVPEYDKAAQDAGWSILKQKLDHSPETIDSVETILEGLHSDIHRKDLKSKIGLGPNEADMEQWANLWGIYLGETLRAMLGGEWIVGHEEAPNLLAIEFPDGTVAFPTATVFRRLNDEEPESVVDYVTNLKAIVIASD